MPDALRAEGTRRRHRRRAGGHDRKDPADLGAEVIGVEPPGGVMVTLTFLPSKCMCGITEWSVQSALTMPAPRVTKSAFPAGMNWMGLKPLTTSD